MKVPLTKLNSRLGRFREQMDQTSPGVEIMNRVAAMLNPGAIPSVIYEEVISSMSPAFLENFMGFGKRTIKFIGHRIGLTIDEPPVGANGFNNPSGRE